MKITLLTIITYFAFLLTCDSQTETNAQHSLNGKWLLEFNSSDIGFVNLIMTFDVAKDSSTFVAYTRKNADRKLIGFWTSTLGRIFTDDFKNGSLLRIENGKIERRLDTIKIKGNMVSSLGTYSFNGFLLNEKLIATTKDKKGRDKGNLIGSKNIGKVPLSDYPSIISKTLQITKKNIYNKSVTEDNSWKKFEKQITSIAEKVEDDLEIAFAFYYYAGKLPFSHYFLMKADPEQFIQSSDNEKYVFLEEKTPETAYLKITSFSGTAAEMDSIFKIILEKNYKNLIIDLRNNGGGNVEPAIKLAAYIADTVYYGGIFLTRKWFDTHSTIPTTAEYSNLPHFSEANFDLILKGIHEQEGLCLKVVPETQIYEGTVFILTDSYTASTCEPLVYGAKQYKMATIVGEKTAGAMLNGEPFEVADGFKIFLPTADYYTADDFRIDKNGVEPNIKIKSDEALKYTLDNLTK